MRREKIVSKLRLALKLLNDGIWRHNAFVVHAVGVFPLVASGVTLKNAVMLSAVTAFVLVVTAVGVSFLGKGIARSIKWAVCAVLSAAAQVPAMLLADRFSDSTYTALEFTLILLCVNTLLYFRRDMVEVNKGPFIAFVSAIANGIGFAVVICIVSLFREIVAFGTVWNYKIPFGGWHHPAALPFAGFFTLAFLIAAYKGVLGLFSKPGKGDEK